MSGSMEFISTQLKMGRNVNNKKSVTEQQTAVRHSSATRLVLSKYTNSVLKFKTLIFKISKEDPLNILKFKH